MGKKHLLQARMERLKLRPLAYARPWDHAHPRTSQRRTLQQLGEDATAIFGGNGTGKTEIGAQLAVATALGRRDAEARAWALANGVSLDRLPDRPGRVLASALTSNDSTRYVRPKTKKYLPAGCSWKNEEGDGEAICTLPNGGEIVFKSNDQGRRSFQGDWFDLVWLDEEHDVDVFEECLMRVGRVPGGNGHIVLTMTPLKGMTWPWHFFQGPTPRSGYRWHEIHVKDNPFLHQGKMARILGNLSGIQRAARELGRFVALQGAIYTTFARQTHVIQPFALPPEWVRWVGIDWGARTGHVVWAAEGPDGTLYVYRELAVRREISQAGCPDSVMVQMAAEAEAADVACTHYRAADSEDPGAIEEAAGQGWFCQAIKKGSGSVLAGIELVDAMLATVDPITQAPVQPRLLFFDGACPVLLSEMEGYVWAETRDGMEPSKPDPRCSDHGLDALRYLTMYRAGQGLV